MLLPVEFQASSETLCAMFPQLDLANCVDVGLVALISQMLYSLFPQLDLATQSQCVLDSPDIPKMFLYCFSLVGPCLYDAGLKLRS